MFIRSIHGPNSLGMRDFADAAASMCLPQAKRKLLKFGSFVTARTYVQVGGVTFRTVRAERNMKTHCSGVALEYHDGDGVPRMAYGVISGIYQHNLYTSGNVDENIPSKDFAHVCWMTQVGRAFGGRAAVVTHDSQHPWNTSGVNSCEDLASLEKYNVVFWSSRAPGTFIVIARPHL